MPRVSVVIPAYRSAPFVDETIRSVLAQTYADYEVVIADHSSDDGTQAVLDTFADEPRVRLLSPTPAGGGAEANWNRVSEAATGEYLKLLPADDLPLRRRVQVPVRRRDLHAFLRPPVRPVVDDGRRLRLRPTVPLHVRLVPAVQLCGRELRLLRRLTPLDELGLGHRHRSQPHFLNDAR